MNNFRTSYKKITYPGALVLTIITIIVSSLLTIRFLTAGINAAFDINESALELGTVKIDIESYKLAAKKLNIPYPAKTSETITPPSPDSPER